MKKLLKPIFRLMPVALIAAALPLRSDTGQAYAALQHGRVAEAERSIRATLSAVPADPAAHQLLCRVFYAQDQVDPAIAECEAAVSHAPADSDSRMWLGRAYGQKASHANPLLAYTLARKVRTCFELAVAERPDNVPAMSDLGEFYVAAPAIVGGGLDKARRLADQMRRASPAGAHRLLAYVAENGKDLKTAETEFQSANAAGTVPDAFVDLGQFYQRHGQPDRAVAVLVAGIQADRRAGPEIVDAASVLLGLRRRQDVAEAALRTYLASPAQTDGAPVFKVHLQLGRVLAGHGDAAGARREFAAAAALAPNYAPAQDAARGTT